MIAGFLYLFLNSVCCSVILVEIYEENEKCSLTQEKEEYFNTIFDIISKLYNHSFLKLVAV